MFIASIAFIILAMITIAFAVYKKKKKNLIICGIGFFFYALVMLWLFSENVITHIQPAPENVTFAERIKLVRDGFQNGNAYKPYNACQNNGMDGPIRETQNASFSHYFFDDFILIIEKHLPYEIQPVYHVEQPEYFFSLPRAAYSLRNTVIPPKKSPSEPTWLMQFTSVKKVMEEPAFIFALGKGELTFECQHYFKIEHHAAVTSSGKVFMLDDETPKFVAESPDLKLDNLTPEKDFGINVLSLMTVDNW